MIHRETHPAEHLTPHSEDECVARIRNLKKSFGNRPVLNGVDLDLYQGENLVILGRSGMGKSVLIKCMVGLIRPDSGEINVLGYDVPNLNVQQLNELRQQIGFSFQLSALYDSMSVRENLEFPLQRNLGISDRHQLEGRIMEALDDVGLTHAVDQMPSELSGGMRKRIGIARTLILRPKIMLYDEPTAGLDPITSKEINDLIVGVRDKYNTASIIITHDITSARETGDRIIALINGVNAIEGTFEELKNANNPELDLFFSYNFSKF
jgi:phospholipid/cholesterol/gamma-HCH transport system ATP-binding protein